MTISTQDIITLLRPGLAAAFGAAFADEPLVPPPTPEFLAAYRIALRLYRDQEREYRRFGRIRP